MRRRGVVALAEKSRRKVRIKQVRCRMLITTPAIFNSKLEISRSMQMGDKLKE